MTAKATGQKLCLTLTTQNAAKPASSEQSRFWRQVQVHKDSSEMLLSSESRLSKMAADFWNSSRLLSPTQPNLRYCCRCLAQEGVGLGGTKHSSTPRVQRAPLVVLCPPVLRELRRSQRGSRGDRAPRCPRCLPAGHGLSLDRADSSTQGQSCCGAARPQTPEPQRWPVSPAQHRWMNVFVSPKHIWELVTWSQRVLAPEGRPHSLPDPSHPSEPQPGRARRGEGGLWITLSSHEPAWRLPLHLCGFFKTMINTSNNSILP